MEVGLYLGIIIYFGILSQTTWADGGNIVLTCDETRKLLSPKHPEDYGDNLNITWNVIAPIYKGIAVVFEEFHTDKGYDILRIQDPERSFSSRSYSGPLENFPPFLSTRSSLLINFQSNDKNSYAGFSLELHCYETSERTSNIKIKSSTRANEGILEVLNPYSSKQWLPICDESWHSKLAERTCTQLGFPGAYRFGSDVDEQYNKSLCAEIDCDGSNFLLQQCALKLKRKESVNASKLNCFTFAYRGCFPISSGFVAILRYNKTELGDCLHTCSAMSSQLAAIRWDGCYCLNESQSQIHNEISDNSRCILECDSSQGTQCPPSRKDWAFHYDVTTGFCEHPGHVAQGWWSSNHTYLGSRLTLTCEPDYVISGSNTIECKSYDAGQKFGWDEEIPHCQLPTSTSTLHSPESTPSERGTTSIAYTPTYVIPIVVVIVVLTILVTVIFIVIVLFRKRKLRGSFTNEQSTVRRGPTSSADDSSPSTVTPIKSTGQVAELEILTSVPPTQNGCQARIRNGPNPQQGEGLTSMLSAEKSPADEYATVNKLRQDDKKSLTAANTDVEIQDTRSDALHEGSDDKAEMLVKYPHHSSCGKSHTMRNRPLPQCPKDGAIKPPVAPRKAQTLTRKDQAGASDFSMKTSKENLPQYSASRDKGHVNKKAPGGSTPYVKARGKRANNTKKKGDHQIEGVSCEDSAVSAPQRLSNVNNSPEKGSSVDKTKKSVSSNNNSNSVLQVINVVPPEQVYFDIDDANGNEGSKGSVSGGAFGLNGIFGDDLNLSTTAVQPASNLYHTLEPTNAEYEDIRNTEAKFNGNGAYDLLNF